MGTFLGSTLGSILGSPYFGKLPYRVWDPRQLWQAVTDLPLLCELMRNVRKSLTYVKCCLYAKPLAIAIRLSGH